MVRTTKRLLGTMVLLALGGVACQSAADGAGQGQPAPAVEAEETIAPVGPDPISAKADASAVSVRLTVRVNRAGATEVLEAVELPGILKEERDTARDYLYEARDPNGVIAVRAVDLDFEERPFGAGQLHGELGQLDEQIIHVDLPGVSLERARGVSVDLARIAAKLPERITTRATFSRMSQQGLLRPFAEVRPAQVATALATRARRVVQPARPVIGQ
jgi:hypothetical protein